jgi:hypothetical protein
MSTKCPGKPIDYCYVQHPELHQTGNGYEMQCPVCKRLYNFQTSPQKMTEEEKQKVIDSMVWP